MSIQLSNPIFRFLCCMGAALSMASAFAVQAATSVATREVVGEITTVIGQGSVFSVSGEQAAVRGLLVRAGDRIETPNGGHVHVRFVDGGLASVRPMSRMLIEDYQQGDANTLAAIKFKLEGGVMRSVTGRWGEANRERFRLNTPVAAIGVKGTDFIVRADSSTTQATVNSGAIIMAPLEGTCASTLGPCQGDRAILLSADMAGKMLEYLLQNGSGAPHLVPAIDLLAQRAGAGRSTEHPLPDTVLAENVAARILSNEPALANKVQDTASIVDTPSSGKPLIWLHNQAGWNVPDNTISVRFDEAMAAGRRAVVGNFFINLYRDESVKKDFSPAPVTAAFQLSSTSANYQPTWAYGLPTERAQISNASLNVDFVNSSLSTAMQLSSPSLGQDNFVASATITPEGIFSSHTNNQNFAGAFSTDGRQAGYVFDKTLNSGKVSGLTLWGR